MVEASCFTRVQVLDYIEACRDVTASPPSWTTFVGCRFYETEQRWIPDLGTNTRADPYQLRLPSEAAGRYKRGQWRPHAVRLSFRSILFMDTLTVAVLGLVAVGTILYFAFKPQPLPGIPHNSHLPWAKGDIPFFTRSFKESGRSIKGIELLAERFGPISQLVLGPGNTWIGRWTGFGAVLVILSDSQEMHDILVNRTTEFDRAERTTQLFHAAAPFGMIALPSNDMFKHHKRWLGLSMSAPYLARMVPKMREGIMEMIDLWSLSSERLLREGSSERAFNATGDIQLAAIDVIASITFGASFNATRNAIDLLESDSQSSASKRPPTPALSCALEQLLERIAKNVFFPFPSMITWWSRNFDWEWSRARKLLYSFLEAQLDKARAAYEASGRNEKSPEARSADNVLDMILEKEKEDRLKGVEALTRDEILSELATYALGGSETTATALQWAVKLLSRHPEVQRKLHRELVKNLPQQAATYEELSSTERLPYLSAVVYEVLRVSGTASGTSRAATCDTILLGQHIPKGTTVMCTLAHTQRHESESYKATSDDLDPVRSASSRRNGRKYGYWADEDRAAFRPERWLTAEGTFNPNAGPWMPFSHGFRGCFGQRLAILELRMFFAMIQTTFFLDKVPAELDTFAARETVTTHPIQCYIRPIPWSETAL